MIRVRGLDHVVLNVADAEAALAWYSGALGLASVRVDEWRRGEAPFPSVRVDVSTILDLVETPRTGQNVHHLCLEIEPLDLHALAASGRFDVVEGPTGPLFGARGLAPALYVRDPDGNVVELRCYASP